MIVVLILAAAPLALGQEQSAGMWLKRASEAMGFDRVGGRIIHYHSAYSDQQNYQSERYYPPFFDAMITSENWFSPRSGVLRTTTKTTYPGGGPPPAQTLYDGNTGVTIRGDRPVPVPRSQLGIRNLDAWAVIYDWLHASDVRVAGRETYRDYPRVVLARKTKEGEQRLFLDPKSGLPVKLEYTEPHYLWGQRRVEYLYSLWLLQGDILINAASFRLADGAVEISSTTGDAELTAAEAVEPLQMPAGSGAAEALPVFLQPLAPQAVQVTPTTYILTNRGYTEGVTLAGNEIFLFDATQGPERAAQDAALMAKLFPGHHKVNVVVTDLAWPHIAGVRYWVAQGATIISHPTARPFLEQIVNRRWTVKPDALEAARNNVKFHFMGVNSLAQFAGGKVLLAPIDGIGSETVLFGYVPADHFLWASDYVQTLTEPSEYGKEVCDAVLRAGWKPRHAAAAHLKLFPWSSLEKLNPACVSGPANDVRP